MSAKLRRLNEIIRPVVEGLGYECWGVEFISQGKHSMLRVYIESLQSPEGQDDVESPNASADNTDLESEEPLNEAQKEEVNAIPKREGGIELADCEKVSRQLSGVLDVEDPISNDYTLEVSSPGMDRPLYTLDHYARFSGYQVEMRLRMPFEGRRKFRGTLAGIEGNDVVLQVEDEEYLFPVESIEKANIVPQFD